MPDHGGYQAYKLWNQVWFLLYHYTDIDSHTRLLQSEEISSIYAVFKRVVSVIMRIHYFQKFIVALLLTTLPYGNMNMEISCESTVPAVVRQIYPHLPSVVIDS